MIMKVKKQEEQKQESEKDSGTYKERSINLFSFLPKYTYYILGIILITVIVVILISSKKEAALKDIVVDGSNILYIGDKQNLDIKFNGIEELKSIKYNYNLTDKNLLTIDEEKINNNKLELLLNPIELGKTTLYLQAGNNGKVLNKTLDLVICNKLSSDIFSENKMYMKTNLSNNLIIDVGFLNECQSDIKITSNNPDVIQVNQKSIKSIKSGEAMLIFSQADREFSLNVTVSDEIKLIESIDTDIKSINLEKGSSYAIPYEIKPLDSDNKYLLWESSDNSIITVSQKGVIKGVRNGTATISIKSVDGSNVEKKISVNVSNVETEVIKEKVENIKLKYSDFTINKEEIYKIEYELEPKEVKYKMITFYSEDESIATVDVSGTVKGIKKGETYIVTKVVNLDDSVTESKIKIIVTEPKKKYINVEKVTINGSYFLDYGETYKLDYTISPKNANIASISYKSSEPDNVYISNNGEITAKNAGSPKIYITVTNMDGSVVEADTRVLVSPSIKVYNNSVDNITSTTADFSTKITNEKNKKISEAGIYIWKENASMPSSPTYKTTNINLNIQDIKFTSKEINTILQPGTTYKYAFYVMSEGRKYISSSNSFTTLTISSLSFKRKYAAVAVGSTYTLPIKIEPANASINPEYKSSNTNIVTVDKNGIIKGIKTGEATVTAIYGDKKTTIIVRVVGAATKKSPATLYDLSEYNTISSWKQMKEKNINYAILRIGITSSINGTNTRVDSSFDKFVKGARENDIELGVYYYSKATSVSAAQNEAKFVLKILNSYPNGTFSLPIYIDYEQSGCPMDANGVKYINAFCDVIDQGGYYCGAYTFYYMYTNYNMASSVKSYWVPDWTCNAKYKDSVKNLGMWQFAAPDDSSCRNPSVYGVPWADSNYLYVDYATLIINSGLNNFK